MRRLIVTLIAPVLAASALLASAGSVAATDAPSAYILDAYFCQVYNADTGDTVTGAVQPDVEIMIFSGWLAKTRGEVQGFVNNVTWVLTVNGQPADVTPYLSGLLPVGPDWEDVFLYPAGTLASGESFHTHYDNVLKSAAFDGWTVFKKGSVYNPGIDCTVTAA